MAIKNGQNLVTQILKKNGGRLSNMRVIEALSEKLGRIVTQEEYEHTKEQLLSSGKIKRTPGRGGCIELIIDETAETNNADKIKPGQSKAESELEKVEQLMTSLAYLPGARAKRNKKTITLLCGDDNDKLFCGWEKTKTSFYVQYRLEQGRKDCSDLAEKLFQQATADIPNAITTRNSSTTTVFVGESVAQCNRVIKRLMSQLEDTTLDNAPQSADTQTKPRNERYYLEIAKLIKFCVDQNLSWPLKNWRKALGFDDVDDLIVIGHSSSGVTNPYREHIVPACLIKEEAIKMAERGASADAIASFISHHLYVVIISPEEAQLLNSGQDGGGMSVKTTMPEGWIFGDDPTERLKAAGIQIRYENHTLPEWKPWRPRKREIIRNFFIGQG